MNFEFVKFIHYNIVKLNIKEVIRMVITQSWMEERFSESDLYKRAVKFLGDVT